MDDCTTNARRLLIDQLVATESPELIRSLAASTPRCEVELFDSLGGPTSVIEAARHSRPEVVVIDVAWLHFTSLFQRILEILGNGASRLVVATRGVDEVLKVQLAHRRLTRVLDLDQPTATLVERLRGGFTSDDDADAAHLWITIPFPAAAGDGGSVARDDIDREILDLLSVGMHDADIADIVHASTQTVKNRVSAMLERSGLRNRTQLAWMRSNDSVIELFLRQSDIHHSDGMHHRLRSSV